MPQSQALQDYPVTYEQELAYAAANNAAHNQRVAARLPDGAGREARRNAAQAAATEAEAIEAATEAESNKTKK